MAKPDSPRIAILGAGPIGLEAALYARALGYAVTVYERGRVGEHLQRWGHVRLFSPFGMNATPLGRATLQKADLPADGECITGREHVSRYLEPLTKAESLKGTLRLDCQVLSVGRRGFLKTESVGDPKRAQQPFRLLVREAKTREKVDEADIVLDCTGTYGQHRWLGDGGVPAVGELAVMNQIAYGLEDVLGERRGHYAGKYVLVVGAGYSAATTVANLAQLAEGHPETWVIWLARGPRTAPLPRIPNDPLRERDRLAARANTLATRTDANVEFHNQAVVETLEPVGGDKGFKVTARVAGKPKTWEVERVIAQVGYTPETALYRELQVHECYASLGPMKLAAALQKHAGGDCLTVTAQGPDSLRNPEPNFYILGAKSFGRNTNFLLRTGFEQVRDVFTLITGKPGLDLYKSAK